MTALGFEPDHIGAWLTTPAGGRVSTDNPALQRMADVVMEAITAAGGNDPGLALTVLAKVQAMIVARQIQRASPDEYRDILGQVGPGVQDEVVRFLRAYKRDLRKAS